MTNCGPGGSGTESCCTSLEVPGGTFYRTYDPRTPSGPIGLAPDGGPTGLADPATVSGFRLDKYLVTVGRFRQYVSYLTSDAGAPPANGSGIHSHLNGGLGLANSAVPGTYEAGWDAADWSAFIWAGPAALSLWNQLLQGNVGLSPSSWTTAPGSQENLPINWVHWYAAYAFCIWDGGFLPTDAEWEFAAAGGSQQREYPWGSTDPGSSEQYENQFQTYVTPGPSIPLPPVGTASLGAAAWGQLDMAGVPSEWILDWYAPYVAPCTDCAYLTVTSATNGGRDLREGPGSTGLWADVPGTHDPSFGFRCARTP